MLFSIGLFYKDTPGHMDITGHRDITLKKRAAFTNASNVVELLAPIHSDIFFQEKLMLNAVDIKIHMTRSKDEFCLMGSSTPRSFCSLNMEVDLQCVNFTS